MIGAMTVLLLYQLIGELLVNVLALPLPGPVMGMVLLFITLMLRGSLHTTLRDTSLQLLQQLSLLFVPAGVGVMSYYALIRAEWLPIVLTLVVSTLLTLGVTGFTMCLLIRRRAHHNESTPS